MSCPPARRVIGLCQVDETALWPGRLVGANPERLTRPNAVRYVIPAGQRAQNEIGRPWSRRLVHFHTEVLALAGEGYRPGAVARTRQAAAKQQERCQPSPPPLHAEHGQQSRTATPLGCR